MKKIATDIIIAIQKAATIARDKDVPHDWLLKRLRTHMI